jgi:hypothetical protein
VRPILGAVVVVFVGCGAPGARGTRDGRDGVRDGAQVIELSGIEGRQTGARRGVVTARGGDRIDWLAFDVKRLACAPTRARVTLAWRPPRPGLALDLVVYGPDDRAYAGAAAGRERRAAELELDGGRVYVAVSAPGRDDAGEYRVEVETQPGPDACAHEPAAPVPTVIVERPERTPLARPRAGRIHAPILRWRFVGGARYLEIARGSADGLGVDTRGLELIDPAGHPVADAHLVPERVDHGWAEVAVWSSLDDDALAGHWTLGYPRPDSIAAPTSGPVDGVIAAVDTAGADVIVRIDRGSRDGVDVGWQGALVDRWGAPVADTWVVVTEVQARTSRALVTGGRPMVGGGVRLAAP